MAEERLSGLDQLISADPYFRLQFIIYVYLQQTGKEGAEQIPSALDNAIQGKDSAQKGTLLSAIQNALLNDFRYYTKEEAIESLKKAKEEYEKITGQGKDYLALAVRPNYAYFQPYLITSYAGEAEKNKLYTGIKNHIEAEIEIYRASCYIFPGLREAAEASFQSYAVGDIPEGAREVEFLSWFNTIYVIDTVALTPAEWYYRSFHHAMNERVRHIFLNVLNMRNSIFRVSSVSKNALKLEDLVFNEEFNARMPEGLELSKGSVFQCFLVRNAPFHELNGVIRLAPQEQSSKLLENFRMRREVMLRLHNSFVSANGGAERFFPDLQEAREYLDSFLEKETYALTELGKPEPVIQLLESGRETALLSERDNFYLSQFYPVISRELLSGPSGREGLELLQDAIVRNSVLPFTTLRRLMEEREEHVIAVVSSLHPSVKSKTDAINYIERERGHTWSYEPLPRFNVSELK